MFSSILKNDLENSLKVTGDRGRNQWRIQDLTEEGASTPEEGASTPTDNWWYSELLGLRILCIATVMTIWP